MPETSEYHFAFVTTPGAESATGPVIGPSRRVRVTVEPLPGLRCNPMKCLNVISEEPLTGDEEVAVAEGVHLLMELFGCTPDMIESVDWDFRVRQPERAPLLPHLDDDDEMFEMFEDYSDGWKHVD